ncbi:MAG: hypothetical protein CME71_00490 [Halobacteriovorax sp.]|nr:hypothetical protein [Halobacteriovorax sp.]
MRNRLKNLPVLKSFKTFFLGIYTIITSPTFLILSLVGNLAICVISIIFYYVEVDTNPKIISYMDALWWGFATATTTGYGDITPVTILGKVISIFLMLTGLALFGMFTALFAEVILARPTKNKV